MENDLISRQVAIDAVEKESQVDGAYGYMDTKSIVDLLNNLPSVQPGIILCEDCKHWERESICEGYCHATKLSGIDEDHFCGYAERRKQ